MPAKQNKAKKSTGLKQSYLKEEVATHQLLIPHPLKSTQLKHCSDVNATGQ